MCIYIYIHTSGAPCGWQPPGAAAATSRPNAVDHLARSRNSSNHHNNNNDDNNK